MLRLRLTSEAQPRWKNGSPAHSTTGVASTNCTQLDSSGGIRCRARWPPISSATTGTVSASPTQSRRDMSASSGFGPASAIACNGSSAMPQIGQVPGRWRRISGCIGQVQMTPSAGAGSAAFGARYFDGSAANFSRQPAQQKS